VTEVTGPLNAPADRIGCRLENGRTITPPGFREAWRKLFELGFMSFSMPLDAGGFGAPNALAVVLWELQSGANTASAVPALTHGAADVIESFALPGQGALPAADDGGPLLGDDVPLRATRRRRRRHQDPGAPPRRQRLRDQRHEVLISPATTTTETLASVLADRGRARRH
jgi:hypothetical protein